MKAQITHLFRLSVDGAGYAGTAKSATIPTYSAKVESYRGGGMSGEIEIAVGTEIPDFEFTLSEVAPGVVKRFGFVAGADKPFTLREAIKDDDGVDHSHRYEIGGLLKMVDAGTTEGGKIVERKFTIAPRSLKEFFDDELLVHIDHEKGIETVGGVEKNKQARTNAGL